MLISISWKARAGLHTQFEMPDVGTSHTSGPSWAATRLPRSRPSDCDDGATSSPQQPRRLRTRKGETQKHRNVSDNDDARRARRASANRTWTVLRAALNHAFAEGKVEFDIAWRKVKPYKGVDAARVRYLTVAEAERLHQRERARLSSISPSCADDGSALWHTHATHRS